MKNTLSTLKAIAQWPGNLPDEGYTSATGANDARLRGLMVVAMRNFAIAGIREYIPDWEPFNDLKPILAYQVLENCQLDCTNFEYDEIIEVPYDDPGNDWKGLEFFDSHPSIFKPLYELSKEA